MESTLDQTKSQIKLSEEQQIVFDKYIQGENIFMTGPGGTGKSSLIKYIVEDSKKRKKRIDVCALTGCAAVLLECNAKTIHSWAGIGLAKNSVTNVVNKVLNSNYKQKNWLTAQILIIDEVSMMSLKLFEILDKIGKKCRKNEKPFGGIQVIFSGDFLQLPPVGNEGDMDSYKFCFESKLWKETFPNQIELKKIFRQKDEQYSKILNQIRKGKISKNSCRILESYVGRKIQEGEIIKPTILFPRKKQAEDLNKVSLNAINEEIHSFIMEPCKEEQLSLTDKQKHMCAFFTPEEVVREQTFLINNINCEKTLKLKKGAQVMCVVNLDLETDTPICNGSQGIVEDFTSLGTPIVKFRNGFRRAMSYHVWKSEKIPNVAIKQIPLILAWAVTIHKSQGATLEMAEIDIGNHIFACGQTYVALSRVKNLDGLYLKSFNPFKIKINLKVVDFYNNI